MLGPRCGRWLESYMYFNPDHGGVEHPKNKLSSTQFDAIESKWRSMLYTVRSPPPPPTPSPAAPLFPGGL